MMTHTSPAQSADFRAGTTLVRAVNYLGRDNFSASLFALAAADKVASSTQLAHDIVKVWKTATHGLSQWDRAKAIRYARGNPLLVYHKHDALHGRHLATQADMHDIRKRLVASGFARSHFAPNR